MEKMLESYNFFQILNPGGPIDPIQLKKLKMRMT